MTTNLNSLKHTEQFVFIALALVIILLFVARERAQLLEERRTTPPIVVLSEEQQSYQFDLGSADVSEAFARDLRTSIAPLLDSLSRTHSADVIEVIGHTDAIPVGTRSNLDARLLDAYEQLSGEDVSAGSNVDLGMMRALTIVRLLEGVRSSTGLLTSVSTFIPYSAGQMIQPGGTIATPDDAPEDPSRRRIEIRLRRSEDMRRAVLSRPVDAP